MVSIGHLAYLSIALRYGIRDTSSLDPHFLRNFSVYEKALKKAKTLNISIPRRVVKKDVELLASELKSSFLTIKGWKYIHLMILAHLLIFDAQLNRIESRNEDGGRWIHVEVHCHAVHFASIERKNKNDSLLEHFITKEEVESVLKSYVGIIQGSNFTTTIREKKLNPHGLRETLRVLLEIKESHDEVPPLSEEERIKLIADSAKAWDKELDPEGSMLRVRGVIHEVVLRNEMTLSSQMLVEHEKVAAENRLNKQRIIENLNANRKLNKTNVSPIVFQGGYILGFLLVGAYFVLSTPKDSFSLGVAWWYFEVGALIAGLIALTYPFITGTVEKVYLDIGGLVWFAGTCFCLLWLIQPETYQFGIAWWHAVLGSFVSGLVILLICPFLKSVFLKEKIEFYFDLYPL